MILKEMLRYFARSWRNCKMKVGILTWFYGSNYGAKAQSYALQQVLTNLGNDVSMVNFRTENYEKVNVWMNYTYPRYKYHPFRWFECYNRNKKLISFNESYNLSKLVNTANEINSLDLDAIIFGSDAIFNKTHPFFNDIYMGVGITTKKIAYSPSCENLDPNCKLTGEEYRALEQFASLAVRDVNTQKLLKNNCGMETKIALDPTLLYDFKEIDAKWDYRNYLLIYSFSAWDEYADRIKDFAQEKNLKILSVGRYCDWADINVADASFEQWIVSFKFANYVFTDSFHGAVFSIKNNKEMILVSREDKKAKIQSLLDDFAINKKFYSGEIIEDYLDDNRIDYTNSIKILDSKRNDSINYLKEALNKVN